jgi:hypothetical protein
MSTEEDRAPLSTEVSPQRHPSDGLVQVQAAAAEERLTIGEKLSGRYRIERELGEGGMGVVYLVTDEQVVGETFAVKVLKDGLDPQALELLRGEVRQNSQAQPSEHRGCAFGERRRKEALRADGVPGGQIAECPAG